jgi:tetratricopeptide (TPR) repeat protein
MSKMSIYTVGGTVQAGSGFYIPRRADEELLELCTARKFAYILSPRQMGKSSSMVRTAERLAEDGVQSIIIDLTQLGVQVTAEEWYLGLLATIEDQLQLDANVVEWWRSQAHLGISQRLVLFFKEILLAEVKRPVVIFVDEIDTTLSLSFTDDFFATIRYLYNARAHEPEFQRLSFVLIGVATPGDLIRDPQRTPFNIGERVELTDWTFEEALPLANGLGIAPAEAEKVLGWVLKWTRGHPYLTQHVCHVITNKQENNWSEAKVDQVVADTFLEGKSEDHNLQFVRDMLTKRAPEPIGTMNTYREIRLGRRSVQDEEQSLIKSHLKLSGIVRRDNGLLILRNPIYGEVFDKTWIKEHVPVNWPKRLQRAAIGLIATLLFLSFPLALYAWNRANTAEKRREEAVQGRQEAMLQRQEAIRQRQIAEQQRQEADSLRSEAEARRLEAEKSKQIAEEQRQLAETRRVEAESQRQIAEQQRQEAIRLRQEADQQRQIAEQQRQEADRLRQEAEQQGLYYKAESYRAKGEYENAEPIYLKNIEYLEKKSGKDDPSIVTALSDLANFYKQQNDYAKAEPLYQRSLAILEKSVGLADQRTAMSMSNLADLYRIRLEYEKAESYYTQSLTILKKLYEDKNNPYVATVTENYAILLRQMKRDNDATNLEASSRQSRDILGSTGAFEGTVRTGTGAPIANALVQFTNSMSEVVTATTTDSEGRFYQGLLLPGIYKIRTSALGFRPQYTELRLLAGRVSKVVPVPTTLDPDDIPNVPPTSPASMSKQPKPMAKANSLKTIEEFPISEASVGQ